MFEEETVAQLISEQQRGLVKLLELHKNREINEQEIRREQNALSEVEAKLRELKWNLI